MCWNQETVQSQNHAARRIGLSWREPIWGTKYKVLKKRRGKIKRVNQWIAIY